MESLLHILIYIVIATVAIYIILYLGNLRIGQRYRQYRSPIWAIFIMIIAIYNFFKIGDYINAGREIIKNGGQPPLEQLTDIWQFIAIFGIYGEVIYSLVIIGVFAIIKLFFHEFGKLFRKKDAPIEVSKYAIAYKKDKTGRVVLGRSWVFPGLFLRYLAIATFVLYLISLLVSFLLIKNPDVLYSTPFLPFAMLVILEMYWYLQHPLVEKEEEIEKEKEEEKPEQDYLALWEEYQEVWPEQLLLAWHYKNEEIEPQTPTNIHVMEAQNLIHAGYSLSFNDYHIIETLNSRKDLIIDDVIIDKVAPLLFTVLLRRLMDGENILMLTPQRGYENANYHKKIEDWIDDWFYKLTTNRRFWHIQVFNKLKDVDLEARIIISSANDIIEKNITQHTWFQNLKTIIFLNSDEIFAESLSTNNSLLNILRHQYSAIQSVVLSDYREALQASVMRNLSVKKNIKEIRTKPAQPKQSFTLFWKLEGTSLFQHQVFTGHIEKYLGAEAILSLLGRREKISPIRMVEQEKLPYYEYLEELDNYETSLANEPVAEQQLKYEAVKEVKANEVSFLTAVEKEHFLLARDKDYNVITTLKKWEAYATDTAFIHVVSTPYLLRDYFVDNVDYFVRTPLYPLSAKTMVSRFEVARVLLERLVTQELSEQEILEEIVWINREAIFAKHELHQLFRTAFNIDIIASNYLVISSDYAFSKIDKHYKKVTKYRLLPQIKDNIKLSFLRNIEIIDKSKNVLKVLSGDFLFQNYLPDQTHAFNGQPYNIRGYDSLNKKLRTVYRSSEGILTYRPDMEVVLRKIEKPLTDSHERNLGSSVNLKICEGQFEVLTKGYFSFRTDISFQPNAHTYKTINPREVPPRRYTLGRLLILTINVADSIDIAKGTATLTALFQEVFFSLFPETNQYLLVGSPINDLILEDPFTRLFPTIRVNNSKPEISEKVIELVFVEDAYQDLGLLQSIFDKWDYILRILDDYLTWLSDGNATSNIAAGEDNILRKQEIIKDTFLKYGYEELPDFLDIDNVKELLQNVIGNNHMTSQREGFYN